MCAGSEGLSLGDKMGINTTTLSQIFATSTVGCWTLMGTNPVPGAVEGSPATNGYQPGFKAWLMRKDLGLAVKAAKSVDANVEFGEKAYKYLEAVEKSGQGEKDWGIVY